jgi:hypothetical protein
VALTTQGVVGWWTLVVDTLGDSNEFEKWRSAGIDACHFVVVSVEWRIGLGGAVHVALS